MNRLPTYNIKIYCGLREGYAGEYHTLDEVEQVLYEYCSDVGFCVTCSPTKFIYRNGIENGVVIGIISYPRFPKSKEQLKTIALDIAQLLKDRFKQNRVSVVCDDETILLGEV